MQTRAFETPNELQEQVKEESQSQRSRSTGLKPQNIMYIDATLT